MHDANGADRPHWAAVAEAVVICPVVPWPPVDGARKRTLRLLETMEAAGVTPRLVSSGPEGERAEALRTRGWPVDVVPESAPGRRARARQHLARRPSPYGAGIARRLEELRPARPAFVQVEHTIAAYYEDRHPAPRWILSTHNIDSQVARSVARAERSVRTGFRAGALASLERRVARAADLVVCASDADSEHFEALGARTLLVPNGIDDAFFAVPTPLPANEQVLFFGRLDYAPNALGLARFLRRGWPRLAAARPDAALRVAGPGLGPALRRDIAAAPRAEVLGVVDDLAAELAMSRAVILPVWEGGGTRLKALEAMAAARPIAGTDFSVTGIGFRDGTHGLLADDPAALADATATLLADPARATALAHAARAHAEKFRWGRVTLPLAEVYARWAGG